jgi:hypothetical protein
MQQHPIPQNVTQYQFRLVGDMTLKQFLELALGLLLAYLFFASNLIFIFKWPLIIASILFGAALAFFPVEDRPLDQWIINFLKAIYAPTRFIWQKTNKIPRLFLFEAHAKEVVNTITKTIKAPTATGLVKPLSDLSDVESEKINSLESIFKALPPVPAQNIKVIEQTDLNIPAKPAVSVRKLNPVSAIQNTSIQVPKSAPVVIEKSTDHVQPAPQIAKPAAVVFSAPSAKTTTAAAPISTPKKINLPASPKLPNLITGAVVDKDGKIVENAIVQIVSADGIPARAMKTNSLGQFYTSTPLSPGTYIIEVDKMGVTFAPQQIVVNGTILSPIELRTTT